MLQANYTYMLKFEGNFEGEGTNTPGISSNYGNYPEIAGDVDRIVALRKPLGIPEAQGAPPRDVQPPDAVGIFTPGVIYTYDSGTPYNITSTVHVHDIQLARDPGYASLPATQALYFGDRGNNFYPSQQRWDSSFEWDAPIYKTIAPYVRFAITNVFNTHYLVSYNTSVIRTTGNGTRPGRSTRTASRRPTRRVPTFGTATSCDQLPDSARTLTAAAGIRF